MSVLICLIAGGYLYRLHDSTKFSRSIPAVQLQIDGVHVLNLVLNLVCLLVMLLNLVYSPGLFEIDHLRGTSCIFPDELNLVLYHCIRANYLSVDLIRF